MKDTEQLERAWRRRDPFPRGEAIRVFHGPGEGEGELRAIAIDLFADHAWITVWEREGMATVIPREEIRDFLETRNVLSAVLLDRPVAGVPHEPQILYGTPPEARFDCREGDLVFRIQLLKAKHPGLFLDHAPLRVWLRSHAKGWRVLNTFAYTGSLSVACGKGGAANVTTLDLSKPTVRWAEENWDANGLSRESARFISGDALDWLARFARKTELFDCVILDPPSFSRGPSGPFSTAKDLRKLHELAFRVLAPGGLLVTSINSANVSREKFSSDIQEAARAVGLDPGRLTRVHEISQPLETFPARDGDPESRYLKGWIFRSPKR